MAKIKSLHLIPCPISDDSLSTIPNYVIERIHSLDAFIVERAKTARRYIKACAHPKTISELTIVEMDKHNPSNDLVSYKELIKDNDQIGMISESGCPAIADPGTEIVALAHDLGIAVKPLVGPSSIFLALMASGLNGQSFCFEGYLPIKASPLLHRIRQIEKTILATGQSFIMIETPYRNAKLLDTLVTKVNPKLRMCIATDITGKTEDIKVMTLGQWRKAKPALPKLPTIFILGS